LCPHVAGGTAAFAGGRDFLLLSKDHWEANRTNIIPKSAQTIVRAPEIARFLKSLDLDPPPHAPAIIPEFVLMSRRIGFSIKQIFLGSVHAAPHVSTYARKGNFLP